MSLLQLIRLLRESPLEQRYSSDEQKSLLSEYKYTYFRLGNSTPYKSPIEGCRLLVMSQLVLKAGLGQHH